MEEHLISDAPSTLRSKGDTIAYFKTHKTPFSSFVAMTKDVSMREVFEHKSMSCSRQRPSERSPHT
jgi:hypothetical protein